jgi:hypothetical protein
VNIDQSVWRGNQTATFEFASKRPLRDELLKDTQIPSIIWHSQQIEFFNANNAHTREQQQEPKHTFISHFISLLFPNTQQTSSWLAPK